jgi:hypothetical protein
MKHFFIVITYIIMCVTGKAIAQTKLKTINIQKALLTEEPFKKGTYDIYKKISLTSNKGESMTITGVYESDFVYVKNLDSLMNKMKANVDLFKDSFANPIAGKRLDILAMPDGSSRVGIRNTEPSDNSYFVINKNQEAGVVKVNQDTIDYIFYLNDTSYFRTKPKYPSFDRYVTVRWILDDLNNATIPNHYILDSLQIKIDEFISPSKNGTEYFGNAKYNLSSDSIKTLSNYRNARTPILQNSLLLGNLNMNFQNYKNLFAPSFSVGIFWEYGNKSASYFDNHTRNQIGVDIETMFAFNKGINNDVKTYTNTFINLRVSSYDFEQSDKVHINSDFSLGYLVRRQRDSPIKKGTFKLSFSSFNYKKLSIQPQIFFRNFKDITPSLKVQLSL